MLRKPQQWVAASFGLGCVIAFGAITATLFSTCSSSDGGSSGGGHGGSEDATALSGNWGTGCLADPGKAGYWFKDVRTFEGDKFTGVFETFSDAACETLVMTQSQNGTFVLGEATESTTAESDAAPKPLDLTLTAIYVALHQPALVQAYNDKNFCGGGWEINNARQITKAACAGSTGTATGTGTGAAEAPDLIYEITVATGGALYFGVKDAQHDGRTAGARPAAIDNGRAYQPQ